MLASSRRSDATVMGDLAVKASADVTSDKALFVAPAHNKILFQKSWLSCRRCALKRQYCRSPRHQGPQIL